MSAAAEGSSGTVGRPRRWWGPADFVTVLRLPLAVAFLLDEDPWHRFAVLAAAGTTDVLDGLIARKFGSSRAGPVLDPVVDKVFTVTAIVAVATTKVGTTLSWVEFAGVLLRDLAVLGGFLAAAWLRRRVTIPARLSGKVVTVMQFATVTAILLDWRHVREFAWATAAVSLWAVVEYARIGIRQLRLPPGANPPNR